MRKTKWYFFFVALVLLCVGSTTATRVLQQDNSETVSWCEEQVPNSFLDKASSCPNILVEQAGCTPVNDWKEFQKLVRKTIQKSTSSSSPILVLCPFDIPQPVDKKPARLTIPITLACHDGGDCVFRKEIRPKKQSKHPFVNVLSSKIILHGFTFEGSTKSPAVYVKKKSTDVSLCNCHFSNNENKKKGGGAIQIMAESEVSVVSCTFVECTGQEGGAIWSKAQALSIHSSCFVGNQAKTDKGDAIMSQGDWIEVTDSAFQSASRLVSDDGGDDNDDEQGSAIQVVKPDTWSFSNLLVEGGTCEGVYEAKTDTCQQVPPSQAPTQVRSPTALPTMSPTQAPSATPIVPSTPSPTTMPTSSPLTSPTRLPTTTSPTTTPTTTSPTTTPTTTSPTTMPTTSPTTSFPSVSPPNGNDNASPTTPSPPTADRNPTLNPVTPQPSRAPTLSPTTQKPTSAPSDDPTFLPSQQPIRRPTLAPSSGPTKAPSIIPTLGPSSGPTKAPWNGPTTGPSRNPTTAPSRDPTKAPSRNPTKAPSRNPTKAPSRDPTKAPSRNPTKAPTSLPTRVPSGSPTKAPTNGPTTAPSQAPMALTSNPTTSPTSNPTAPPSASPTSMPTASPTSRPSGTPTLSPIRTTSSPMATLTFDPPPGLITTATANQRVVIPEPPSFRDDGSRTNCPHDQAGLLNWHDPSTWSGGVLPMAGADVTLPTDSKVLLNRNVEGTLGIITIPSSSELIVGNGGVSLHLHGMDVQGTLRMGSETCRLDASVSLTLHGSRPADVVTNRPAPSYKGIVVNGGHLELHGKRYYRTWSRLAQTVEPGDTVLYLQHTANWEGGQEIVLVTSALKDARDFHQNEVLVVDHVRHSSSGSTMVVVTTAVQHRHLANSNYQVEVGLLSRKITIAGAAEDSEPTDPDPLNCLVPNYPNPLGTNRNHIYGSTSIPCPDKELTGFGGHILVENGGVAHVEGVELFRMGQTNVLGRYPMHFHILGNGCAGCYMRDSSIHKSYYRCVSVHGSNLIVVTENVGYDVVGYCYYLEDGVEEENVISYNLAAHIHVIGEPAWGTSQLTGHVAQTDTLTLPADITASGFYITNTYNMVVGNAASGGWAGYAFPVLESPVGDHKDVNMSPASRTTLQIDGNTAHSTGWWFKKGAGFYLGGALYYDENNGGAFTYTGGRDTSRIRDPCAVDNCSVGRCGTCAWDDLRWSRLTNSKVFLTGSDGLNSWSGRIEIVGFEVYDMALAAEGLTSGFWIDNMLAVCRTGDALVMGPGGEANQMDGDGFYWYDTGQEHILTNSVFRNCGIRSAAYEQYGPAGGGCSDTDVNAGCATRSTVFGFVATSNVHNPEVMQGTAQIGYENCGRRFRLDGHSDTDVPQAISGRLENWLDTDGTASGRNVPILMGSGYETAGLWWKVGPEVVHDDQGPLEFIPQKAGPSRGLGHIRIEWDSSLHNTVGRTNCGGFGNLNLPCDFLGFIKHWGPMFESDNGLPMTANPDVAGPVGGYGWLLQLNEGAPHTITITTTEVFPDTPLVLGVAYPLGTTFVITAKTCNPGVNKYLCEDTFVPVASRREVRNSQGNTYHFDATTGLLTVRIIQLAQNFLGFDNGGNPTWSMPDLNTPGRGRTYAFDRFSRGGVTLPQRTGPPLVEIKATCPGGTNGAYCVGSVQTVVVDVCSDGYVQVAYDRCCRPAPNDSDCEYSDPFP